MPLHRTQNPPPVVLPARLTSFVAHNLGDNPRPGHGALPPTQPALVSHTRAASGLGEIRTPDLPFAAPLALRDQLATA